MRSGDVEPRRRSFQVRDYTVFRNRVGKVSLIRKSPLISIFPVTFNGEMEREVRPLPDIQENMRLRNRRNGRNNRVYGVPRRCDNLV